MHPSLLQNISQPSDLKRLNSAQIQQLCGEIRQFLLDSVSKTGGHLASNLGAVELTVALHRIFETPRDAFVFDVGHQCYTHKLLTGRYKRFGTLRQLVGQRIAAEGVNQVEDSRRITLYGARENEIIDYFPPFLILFVVVLFAVFGGHKWRRRVTFER